jgi:uncharacterized protein YegJ (DUF2314 family)
MRWSLVLCLLCACNRSAEPAHVVAPPLPPPVAQVETPLPFPAGALFEERSLFLFGVYHLSPQKAALALAKKLAKQNGFEVTDQVPKTPPTRPMAIVISPPLTEVTPPPEEELKYRGRSLSEEQKQRLQHAAGITVLSFVAVGKPFHSYRTALAIVRELAQKSDGLIHDATTRGTFTPQAFATLLDRWTGEVPDVRQHVTLDFYPDGELGRIVSLGMQKFGLPDVAIAQVSQSDSNSMASLMNVTLQTMIERGAIERAGELEISLSKLENASIKKAMLDSLKKGGSGTAIVRLAVGKPVEGDAENRLAEIVFPGPADSLQIRHNEALAQLFGSEDSLSRVPDDDPALLAASAHARATLKKLKPRFSPKPTGLDHLLVKAPFETPSGKNEWMWIEVVHWENKKIEGILENDPFEVKGLKAGARVEADEDSIYDYILQHADGTTEGNETAKLIQARQKSSE